MNFNSKKTALIILGVSAILLSRVMFVFFNDPEGPNLLVVTGMAAVVYLLSLTVFVFSRSISGSKKFLFTLFTQIIIVTGLYLFLR